MGFYTRLPRRGRMPLTLPWKGRCAVYQLTVAVATQMSHKLVYGADELHFFKALALVLWFSKRFISLECQLGCKVLSSLSPPHQKNPAIERGFPLFFVFKSHSPNIFLIPARKGCLIGSSFNVDTTKSSGFLKERP